MRLLSSWKNALMFFLPKNMQLFGLMTLKALLEVYTLIVRYWWLSGPIILLDSYCYLRRLCGQQEWLGATAVSFLTVFVVVIATRPSVQNKSARYLKNSLTSIVGYVITCSISYGIFFCAVSALLAPIAAIQALFDVQVSSTTTVSAYVLGYFLWCVDSLYKTFFALAYFDAGKRWYSFWTPTKWTLKMLLYNAPVLVFFICLYAITDVFLYWAHTYWLSQTGSLVQLISAVLVYALFTIPMLIALVNVYVKNMYGNVALYMGDHREA